MTNLTTPSELDRLSTLITDTLAQCGQTYTCADGHTQHVRIRRRALTRSQNLLLIQLDTERLPRGVMVENLVSPRMIHQLTAVTHHHVQVLNTTGVTYVVHLGAVSSTAKLPDYIALADVLPDHPGGLVLPVGHGPNGPVWIPLDGHFLVGGETRAGKTNWLLAALVTLLQTNSPAELQLAIIDPKAVDFLPFASAPHLVQPLATEPAEAEETLAALSAELDARRQRFLTCAARNLRMHNERSATPLPYLLIVIDEVTDLIERGGGPRSTLQRYLVRLASLGAAFGIYLMLATQNPKASVLDTLIKGNMAYRIAHRVVTSEHSRVILGTTGAEKLPKHPGRLVARLGDGHCHQLQGYALTEEDLSRISANTTAATGLGKTERAMLEFAQQHLDGHFREKEICAGLECGKTAYRQARAKLERSGYLTRGPKNDLVVVARPEG